MNLMQTNKNYVAWAVVLLAVIVMVGFKTSAPPATRLGFLSINQLVVEIPEYQASRGRLDTMIYELNQAMEGKVAEWEEKQQTFVRDSASMNALIREDKRKELQSLTQSIQAFKQVSEDEVAKQDSALVQPILDEIQLAIDQVAEKKGYTHILNTDVRAVNGPAMVLYANDQSYVGQLVLEEYFTMKK